MGEVWRLAEVREALSAGEVTPVEIARECIGRANGSASRNTYLWMDEAALVAQAEELPRRFPDVAGRPPMYGVPVSLKDCFDLAGTVTTFGSGFYARHRVAAERDSAMAERLRAAGCMIVGKTHLHPLAYGITGQNAEFGDCVQPRDAGLLTGGSSSGAAASVQEGSALVGIGTDTGGSIRVPAALCGLVGFRASHAIAGADGAWPEVWRGADHLARSFDTPGFLVREAGGAQAVAAALFGAEMEAAPAAVRVGFAAAEFLGDCEADVRECYEVSKRVLAEAGASVGEFDTEWWADSVEIFAGIQAHEASEVHRGHFGEFDEAIAQRLRWGESLGESEVSGLRVRHEVFRRRMAELLERFDVLVLPCAPSSRMRVDEDQSRTRATILRYTTPFSLAGLPVLTLPGERMGAGFGTGVQIAAASGREGMLLALGAAVEARLAR